MRRIALLILITAATAPAVAQVVTTTPVIVTESNPVTVFFHADEGDRGLVGYTGDVYAHTGVITNLSDPKTGCKDVGWRHVKTNWGENTDETRLSRVTTDLYALTISDTRAYYGVLPSEQILALAFVFRDAAGSRTGKDVGSCDIFVGVTDQVTSVAFASPIVTLLDPLFVDTETSVAVNVIAEVADGSIPTITLNVNGEEVAQQVSGTLQYELLMDAPGSYVVQAIAVGAGASDTTSFRGEYLTPTIDETRPPGIEDGITYDDSDETRATLSLFAPYKEFVYVIGDFNGWEIRAEYQMRRDAIRDDSVHFWIALDGLEPGMEYAFQYLIDGRIRVADPYTTKTLDPKDRGISASTYPDLKPYPDGKTVFITSVLQTGKQAYAWQADGYERPAKKDLVIYELLVRDFVAKHDYATLADTLDYLDRLGVTAIELMPVSEFEDNESWGYNPSFYFAPDKYYGPENDLRRFIDEAHSRGIAVIMDIVLNHSEGESPLIRMYEAAGVPTAQNPWYNTTCAHPLTCWGQDFDHQSSATRYFVDRVTRYWLEEFRFDGFRFDFTQGFTNNASYGNYDASRIAILERMVDRLWEVDPDAYVILEHWTDNSEETVLANYGMMLWANVTYNYQETAMGYHRWDDGSYGKSDFSWGYFREHGWSVPHVVTYMESHDEERLMFKNITYGNSSGDYSTKDLPVALDRMKASASFFLTVPGPRMIWQFGELGYDVGIFFQCRTCNKPIRWYYLNDPLRKKLYDTYAALIALRRAHDVFTNPATSVSQLVDEEVKYLRLNHPWNGEEVVIVGNFDVIPRETTVYFPTLGTWHDFFVGTSLEVSEQEPSMTLGPGEFHIYTNFVPAVQPAEGLVTVATEGDTAIPTSVELLANWPNPFNPSTTIAFDLPGAGSVRLDVYDLSGRLVKRLVDGVRPSGRHEVSFDARGLASGVYVYRLVAGGASRSRTMLLVK